MRVAMGKRHRDAYRSLKGLGMAEPPGAGPCGPSHVVIECSQDAEAMMPGSEEDACHLGR